MREQSVDIAGSCLACQAGHRYFVADRLVTGTKFAKAAGLFLPRLMWRSLENVARFWLSDPNARAHLNDQLAELLRCYLERRHRSAPATVEYCPDCAGRFAHDEQPDIWVMSLRCANDHAWATRGSHLGRRSDGVNIRLECEPTDSVVASLAKSWLSDNSVLSPQLHRSLRRVLRALAQWDRKG